MVPEGWAEGRISDHLTGLEAGVSVNGEDRTRNDAEYAVLKVSAVSNGVFDEHSCKVIDDSELRRAKTNPKAGQVIISRSNTEELVGASAASRLTRNGMNDLFTPLTDTELEEVRRLQTQVEPTAQPIHVYWLARRMPPASQAATYIRTELEVGRNASCPCGSDRKCCGTH